MFYLAAIAALGVLATTMGHGDKVIGLLALGFLIVVHEAGHYFVARWCRMRVERFSIGFGPGLVKHRGKSGTVFQLAPIPFGGFVEIRGMNIAEDIDPDDRQAYPNRPAWQRFLTIFAGPATNYLSAIVLAFALFTCHGVPGDRAWYGVGDVRKDFDAVGKLEPGDRILAVDGVAILAGAGETLTERVTKKKGAAIDLTVRRDGAEVRVSITPKAKVLRDFPEYLADFLQATEKLRTQRTGTIDTYLVGGKASFLLGIQLAIQVDPVKVGIFEAASRALKYPIEKTQQISSGLYDIITGKEKADPGGPKRIVEEFASAFSHGWDTGIQLLMMLSVYLGLFNLLPLPALDGGRLVFLTYELVTRRRANAKIESMVHMGGIMVLFVVMILVTLHDFHVF